MSQSAPLFVDGIPEECDAYCFVKGRGIVELGAKTELNEQLYQISESAWTLDLNAGHITFMPPSGGEFKFSAQVAGTYNKHEGTWLWGWDHPSVEPEFRQHALVAFEYGKANEIERLTTRKFRCSEEQAWELTAITCHLGKANGAYRGMAGLDDSVLVFVTYASINSAT